ncbi:hypothetical protein GCM10011586_24320 [Silvibacterium dinghuense]|nr:hypothetical protein GCM10011586_24320 [Silvibacterium dinghuense]
MQSSDEQQISNALLSAAYYDPDWKWVQEKCLAFSYHRASAVRWNAATCFGHLARIHRQLDLEIVLQRLEELRADPLVKSSVEDALDDIRFYMKFQ